MRSHVVPVAEAQASGAGGTQDGPAPDVTGTIAMSATTGRVALVTSQAALSCGGSVGSCGAVASVRDLAGYGGASDAETAPVGALTNATAAVRAAGGCTDSDDNATDFARTAPAPRNRAAAANACDAVVAPPDPGPADPGPSVTSTTPVDGAGGVDPAGDLTVTFSEAATVGSGAFTLRCGTATIPLAVSGGPSSFALDPATELPRGTRCTLTVEGDAIFDSAGTAGTDAGVSFTTQGLVGLRVHDLQGAQHRSPFEGALVAGVPGVVTARRTDGFYLQDPQPDADDRTSEGILVFTRGTPPAAAAVDAAVRVSGQVAEFRSGSATGDNLTTTEITAPTVEGVTPAGAAIAPTVVGTGGRVPPGTVIDDDSTGDVERTLTFDPDADGIDFYESLEGMLTQVDDAVAVGPTSPFGEIPVLGDGGARAGLRTARGGVVVRPTDFNPERIILDDDLTPGAPSLDVGDGFTASVRAVVDYSFGNFKFRVLGWPGTRDGGLEREVTEDVRPNELAVASFNVENLDPGNPPDKFRRLAETLVGNLRAPDLVALEEIQDDDGARSPAPTTAGATYARLIAAIRDAGGPTYEYRQIDPNAKQDGGEPDGNIRVGFLFRTDRGLSFVDRPGGDANTATREDESRSGVQLTQSPGRIDPANPAFRRSRKPLAGEFRYRGRALFAIANHFNSKGGDDPLFGRVQPPVRSSEAQRHEQAAIVNAFVDSLLAADRRANVIVLGDLNDFEFSQTLDILEGGGELSNLVETLPAEERYSYVFEGNSQVLDQILVSAALLSPKPEYDVVHVNAEFADQVSDHDPPVARLRVPGAPAGD